jgi:outer membrane protein OmpA-like peptidoglycan-associated protein
MLVTTQTANKLIADVWFARADFAKDHPDKIEALVRGIFDAMEDLKTDENKNKCAKLMADGYNIPATETIKMFGDAHSTNWAENYQFFLNQNNPTNFERVWSQAYYLYRRITAITHPPVKFDTVMDFSVIEKLGKEEKYKSQKDEYQVRLAPKAVADIHAESDEILTNTIVIQFFPNSWDIYMKINKDEDGKTKEVLYDPNVDNVLQEVAKLAGQFSAARIIVEGHTDSSRRGQVPEAMVKELSLNRANAVRESLVNKYQMDPNRFAAAGLGWDRPADPNDPENQAKNRRVEIKVYTAEKQ